MLSGKSIVSRMNKLAKGVTLPSIPKNAYMQSVLSNRAVLYGLVAIVIIYIVYLVNIMDVKSLIVLTLVGWLISFFNKNMIVILFFALTVTYILRFVISSPISEGAQNMDESEESINSIINEEPETNVENDSTRSKDQDYKKTDEYKKLKTEYNEFKDVQKQILSGVKEMTPLFNKAEKFITKATEYKEGLESKKNADNAIKA
jgi:hypothetical protein